MARYALTDIHGCSKTFRKMVEAVIQLQPEDHLYLLGDYINKGPDSKGVLDYIFQLQQEGFQVTCLRGNHDQLLLDAIDKGEHTVWISEEEKQKTLDNFGVKRFREIPSVYINFIRSLPLLVVLDNYILVHAGLNFTLNNILATDNYTLMNAKVLAISTGKLGSRRLIRGHVPTPQPLIEKVVKTLQPIIPIDAGCVFYRNKEYGKLCGLDLDTLQLHWQKNIDIPYRIKIKA